jgi:hypothetical protein
MLKITTPFQVYFGSTTKQMTTPELQRVDSNNFDPNTFDINLSTIDELDDIDDEEISGK